jgi:hypothetical protein
VGEPESHVAPQAERHHVAPEKAAQPDFVHAAGAAFFSDARIREMETPATIGAN